MRHLLSIVLILLLSAQAAFSQPAVVEPAGYTLSHGQKMVKRSTDVVAIALPAAALVGTLCMKDWKGLLQGVETAAVTAAFTLALKYGVREKRPDGSNWHSFPSGHSAVSFASSTYICKRYGWKFGVPAYILSTYVAWGRCFSKQHYVWDCVVGAAIGTGSALIFTTKFAKKHNLQLAPTADMNTRSMGLYASFNF